VKKHLLTFSAMLTFGLGFGQNDSIPKDSLVIAKSKQQIYFGIDIHGSLPLGDFDDTDRNNASSGYADLGYGGGFFANFYWDSGLFMKLNLDYTYRTSTLTDGAVDEINADLIGNPTRTIDNPDYHHGTVTAAGGYNLKLGNAEIYAMAEAGYAFNYFGESSYRAASGVVVKFDDSMDNTLCYGGGIGAVFFERLLVELSYLNLGTPTFQAEDDVDESQFDLPMETLRVKIGFVLFR
jgi:hypothetical protein